MQLRLQSACLHLKPWVQSQHQQASRVVQSTPIRSWDSEAGAQESKAFLSHTARYMKLYALVLGTE